MRNIFSRRTRINFIGAAALCGGLLGAGSLSAATDTADVEVTATVTANCNITSSGLAFGAYDPVITNAASNLDASGTLTVTCTSGSTGVIALGQGANADTGSTDAIPLRRMVSGLNFLSYALFQDAGRTTLWGNTTATDVSHSGDGTATDVTIYGRVTSAQNVPAGAYADTVLATVTF
jgi:spore coat protein U-like protein